MRVLGVDPGYDRLGVAVLEYQDGKEQVLYSSCIETSRSATLPERLAELGTQLATVLKNHRPTALAIETLFFNKNQKTGIGVAHARGVVVYLAIEAGCAVYEFGPQEIKVAVTGYGNSDKGAVIDMVQRLVPTAPSSALDDEHDAIAVAMTCLAHHGRGR